MKTLLDRLLSFEVPKAHEDAHRVLRIARRHEVTREVIDLAAEFVEEVIDEARKTTKTMMDLPDIPGFLEWQAVPEYRTGVLWMPDEQMFYVFSYRTNTPSYTIGVIRIFLKEEALKVDEDMILAREQKARNEAHDSALDCVLWAAVLWRMIDVAVFEYVQPNRHLSRRRDGPPLIKVRKPAELESQKILHILRTNKRTRSNTGTGPKKGEHKVHPFWRRGKNGKMHLVREHHRGKGPLKSAPRPTKVVL